MRTTRSLRIRAGKGAARTLCALLLGAVSLAGFAGCDNSEDDVPARLRVVHAASSLTSIDFYVDFDLFARNLSFRQASPYVEWKDGLRLLEARTTRNNQNVSIARQELLQAGRAYTVLVAGTESEDALVLLEDDRSTPPSGQALLRVAHAAVNAGAVAVLATPEAGGSPVLDVPSLAFREAAPQTAVDAGTYEVVASPADGGGATERFVFEAGRRYLVVVAHVGSTRALSLFTVVDG